MAVSAGDIGLSEDAGRPVLSLEAACGTLGSTAEFQDLMGNEPIAIVSRFAGSLAAAERPRYSKPTSIYVRLTAMFGARDPKATPRRRFRGCAAF